MSHTWVYEDDILIFYLYRYEIDNSILLNSVALYMGFDDIGSLRMRLRNFMAVDGKEHGLSNYAELTKKVYNDYQNIDQETHRKKCLEIMESYKNSFQ